MLHWSVKPDTSWVTLTATVWSSHKWTGSRISVIWTWSNWTKSETQYMRAFANVLMLKKCHIHALIIWQCKTPAVMSNAEVKCVWFIWNKQKQQSKCYTRTAPGPTLVLNFGLFAAFKTDVDLCVETQHTTSISSHGNQARFMST